MAPASKLWRPAEEILLVGSLYTRYALKGSLFPNERIAGGSNALRNGQGKSETFQSVYLIFETMKARCAMASQLPHRTPSALSRHFKEMKAKLGSDGDPNCGLLPYLDAWFDLRLHQDLHYKVTKEDVEASTLSIKQDCVLIGAIVQTFFAFGSLVLKFHHVAELYRANLETCKLTDLEIENKPDIVVIQILQARHRRIRQRKKGNLVFYLSYYKVMKEMHLQK